MVKNTSSETSISIVKETTFGVTPSNPKWLNLASTGQPSLQRDPARAASQRIQATRNVVDNVLTKEKVSGSVNNELSFGEGDEFMEAALQGSWQNKPQRDNSIGAQITEVTATQYTIAAGDNFTANALYLATGFSNSANNKLFQAFTATTNTEIMSSGMTPELSPASTAKIQNVGFSTTLIEAKTSPNRITAEVGSNIDFTSQSLRLTPGQWVKIGGKETINKFDTDAVNGWARIKSVNALDIEFDIVPSGWVADAGAGKSIYVFTGDYLRNGTNQVSYSLERKFGYQATPSYEYFTGLTADTMGITIDSGSDFMTTSYTFQGVKTTATTTRIAGSTDFSKPAFDIFSAKGNIATLNENGVAIPPPNFCRSLTINLNNSINDGDDLKSINPQFFGSGQSLISGTLGTYFGDLSIYNRVLSNTKTSISLAIDTPQRDLSAQTGISTIHTKSYVFDMPSVNIDGSPEVGSVDEFVDLDLEYMADDFLGKGYTLQAQRFAFVQY